MISLKEIRSSKLEKVFMDTAISFSTLSTCARVKVGAVLVKNKRIVSTGFNGVPAGMLHCEDFFLNRTVDKEEHRIFSERTELHAEMNLLAECLKNGINPAGGTLYVTTSPCNNCSKLILAVGIKEVVYLEKYDREIAGIELLNNNGIICKQY